MPLPSRQRWLLRPGSLVLCLALAVLAPAGTEEQAPPAPAPKPAETAPAQPAPSGEKQAEAAPTAPSSAQPAAPAGTTPASGTPEGAVSAEPAQPSGLPPASTPATRSPEAASPASGSSGAPPRIPFPTSAPSSTGSQGTSTTPAWSSFIAGKKTKVNVDFRGAEIDNVLKFFSMAAGVTIVKDQALKGPVTIVSAKQLSLDEAFRVLDAVLSSKGYRLVKEGPLLRIAGAAPQAPSTQWPSSGDPARSGDWGRFGDRGRFGGSDMRPNEIRVFELQHADAQQVARVINDLFPNRGGFMGMARMRRAPGGDGQQAGMPMMQTGPEVRASADDYTNSVVVNANPEYISKVEVLIRNLDKEVTSTMQTRVFPLEYASATEMADVISSVLLSTAPGQRTAASQSLPFEQRIRGGGGRTAFYAVRAQVVPNERTNSLIVTATPSNLAIAEMVIQELDKPVEFESTTYVLPLANAQAMDVAYLLDQALRTGGTSSSYYSQQRYRGTTQRRTTTYRPQSYQRRSAASDAPARSRAQASLDEVRLPDALDEEALSEEGLDGADPASSRQFPGWRGGAGSSGATVRVGRAGSGQIVNLLDLAGQANVVADPNTNSLIITTTPENYDAIKEIVKQLDTVPEQVLIEALVVEAALDSTSKLGMEWSWMQENVAGASVGANVKMLPQDLAQERTNFKFSVIGPSLQTVLTALSTDKRFNVLSTPRIFTANNRQAQINISQRVPYIMSTRETDAGTVTYNYGYLDVGLVLDVTPHITQNGMVNIEVTQEANELQGFTSYQAPLISQRSATTTITVRDGETVVLGGMIREQTDRTVNKTPILGDLPILGGLFRSRGVTKGKTELMIFLTPRVVRDVEQAAALSRDQQRQVKIVLPSSAVPPTDAVAPNGVQPAAAVPPTDAVAPNGAQPAPVPPSNTASPNAVQSAPEPAKP